MRHSGNQSRRVSSRPLPPPPGERYLTTSARKLTHTWRLFNCTEISHTHTLSPTPSPPPHTRTHTHTLSGLGHIANEWFRRLDLQLISRILPVRDWENGSPLLSQVHKPIRGDSLRVVCVCVCVCMCMCVCVYVCACALLCVLGSCKHRAPCS